MPLSAAYPFCKPRHFSSHFYTSPWQNRCISTDAAVCSLSWRQAPEVPSERLVSLSLCTNLNYIGPREALQIKPLHNEGARVALSLVSCINFTQTTPSGLSVSAKSLLLCESGGVSRFRKVPPLSELFTGRWACRFHPIPQRASSCGGSDRTVDPRRSACPLSAHDRQ